MNPMTPAAAVTAAAPIRAPEEDAACILKAAERVLTGLERGLLIEASVLRRTMEEAFGGSDAEGLWTWKAAYEACEAATGSAWRPRTGSMTNRRTMTAAMIDSRDFIAAKRRAEIEPLLPAGPRIAFTGGVGCNDHARIWKARARHPDMVLIHGGSLKGAEQIAACWANNRGIPRIVFKPDWTRHRNAAPFKRNDRILEALTIGVIAFPSSGISRNLADKARKIGIAVWKFGEGQGGPR